MNNAKEAAKLCKSLYRQKPQDSGAVYKRSAAAKALQYETGKQSR